MRDVSMTQNFVGVWILGGLGNQMFQYAAGYSLAKRLGAELQLDLSHFSTYNLRDYRLNAFGIEAKVWDKKFPTNRIFRKLYKLQCTPKLFFSKKLGFDQLYEKRFHVNRRFFEQQKNCYIFGYWQSPKYFHNCANDLKNIFDLSQFATKDMLPILKKADRDVTISIHLRRGDYTNPNTLAAHGLCELSYYERARKLMLRCEPNAEFLVFSDDVAAAEKIFSRWTKTTIVSCATDLQEMLVMSRCRHHIIANSSFSWWAAWLGSRPDSLVVAPRNWFSRERMKKTYVLDLFPDEWILL